MKSDDKPVTALIIGDPHFKEETYALGCDFINKVVKKARKLSPTFIVDLGDTLHKHSKADRPAFEQAESFISQLREIAPLYVLIGNHDFDNNKQFLSEKHWFTSFKRWTNPPIIVDSPISVEYGEKQFVFCPYVPKGRFIEALETLIKKGCMWEMADTIFAHQEFYSCYINEKTTSSNGDKWDKKYPPIISGHIHKEHTIPPNIFYVGTPIQHTFGEKEDKFIWLVTWDDEDPFSVEKIDLKMKKKKEFSLPLSELETFDMSVLDNAFVKLKISGTSEEFKVFRRGKLYKKLEERGVKIDFVPNSTPPGEKKTKKQVSFISVLKEIVRQKTPPVQDAYREIIGTMSTSEDVVYELVFEDMSE